MLNIRILNNFPLELLDAYKDFYQNFDKTTINVMISQVHYAVALPKDLLAYTNAFLPVPLDRLDMYAVLPDAVMIPHIDRGRKTALQIPLDVDTNNSYTFAAKYEDLSMLTPKQHQYDIEQDAKKIVNTSTNPFYEWNDNLFDKYDLSKPILQNVSAPHGGVNNAKTLRIFMSGNYLNHEYKYVVDAYKDFY